jgi:hypothetical protein
LPRENSATKATMTLSDLRDAREKYSTRAKSDLFLFSLPEALSLLNCAMLYS